MAYRDNRERQFTFGSRRSTENESETRQRSFARENRNDREDHEDEPIRPRRRTLREREMEEEEEERIGRYTRHAIKKEDEEYYDDDEEEEKKPKAPLAVRLFAWVAGLAILFAAGYFATTLFFSWTDSKNSERIGSVYGSGDEVKAAQKAETNENGASSETKDYTLWSVKGDEVAKRSVQLKDTLPREENMKKILEMQIDALKEAKLLDPSVSVNEIYQGDDCLYTDLTPAFASSLKSDGEIKRTQCLKAITSAVSENFSQIKKIKFYVNGKEITSDKAGIDLSVPWEESL
ncbi:MAG: GerMN domain-containing protein [Synergistes sp.]|nr:GerMN domain-containing protein [Synergistes sp.]